MSSPSRTARDAIGPDAPDIALVAKQPPIANLSDFFALFAYYLRAPDTFWYRGHASFRWGLTPSALRYPTRQKRQLALDVIADFRRLVHARFRDGFPAPSTEFQWMMLAQHYGLPTRILDWTESLTVALYFACFENDDDDGLVIALNPVDLNNRYDKAAGRILDPHKDDKLIGEYAGLKASQRRTGKPTVAVNPIWNTERIRLQRGAFTLHGNRAFMLDRSQVDSLFCVQIPAESKATLRRELHGIGVDRMSLFPEPEHVAWHLKALHGLEPGSGPNV